VLLAVPNVSEGRDRPALDAIGAAFGPGLIHSSADPDHHRAVFTVQGEPGALAEAVLDGAREAIARIDLTDHEGAHPRVGAVDVAPIVYLDRAQRGAAIAEALVLADRLGAELDLPVFLYGALAGGRTRAELRKGGLPELRRRMQAGELAPDAGPARLHPTAGAVLVAARPPLAAFNLELAAPATVDAARAIAARIREGGSEGLAGVRALGLALTRAGIVQVSTNIEDLATTTPGDVTRAVQRHATVAAAELVAPAPRRAFESFPAEIPLRGAPLLD
jgi:glutamate formiminotransferase